MKSTVRFNDGVEFDTDCTYRITSRPDGYYVVGNGFLCPVEDREDGEQLIAKLTDKNKSTQMERMQYI